MQKSVENLKMKIDKCSFCGREKKEVNLLIAGMEGHICDSCVEQAHAIVEEEFKQKIVFPPRSSS
jgi:ATP-dependent Clp protease ATP-binding subunit ClpX